MDAKSYYKAAVGSRHHDIEPRIKIVAGLIEDAELKILDIGCYDGYISTYYKKSTNYVIGIDISEEPLTRACNILDEVYCVDLDSAWNCVGNNSCDIVVAGAVLEHVFDFKNIFSEAARVLKNGGRFIHATPNAASLKSRFELAAGTVPSWFQNYEHIRLWTRGYLNLVMSRYGFSEEYFSGCYVDNRPFYDIHARLFPNFAPIIIGQYRLRK